MELMASPRSYALLLPKPLYKMLRMRRIKKKHTVHMNYEYVLET